MVHPETLWAQRSSEDDPAKNVLYVTLNVPELNDDYTLKIEGNHLQFNGATHPPQAGGTASTVEQKTFELSLDLFGEVEEVRRTLNGKSLSLVLRKKELGSEYWPRLTKDKVKLQYLKTDFSKWKDEDEQDEADEPEEPEQPQGPPGGGMGGMPGMGGAGGGMDFASMMQGMGGAGGAGGAGGMDFEALMKQMQASGGLGGGEGGDFGAGGEFGDAPEEEEEDDEGPPPLEEA